MGDTKPCEQVTRESMAMEKLKQRRANFARWGERRDWLLKPFKGTIEVLTQKCSGIGSRNEVELKWDKHNIIKNGHKVRFNKSSTHTFELRYFRFKATRQLTSTAMRLTSSTTPNIATHCRWRLQQPVQFSSPIFSHAVQIKL